LDLRLILGVVLVLGAVALGAVVVSRARSTDREVAVTHDLAAGTTLRTDDLRLVDAQLPDRATYVEDLDAAVGKVLNRPLAAGELLPVGALGAPARATTVTIPFGPDAAPSLHRGQRIVVWLSTPTCPDTVLLPDVVVQDVGSADSGAFGGTGPGQDVVLTVSPALADRVVTALAIEKAAIRAGVLTGASDENAGTLPELSACTDSTAP
jgi:hypothetical protein